MALGASSRSWRWFSFVFGVLVPIGVWGWVGWSMRGAVDPVLMAFVLFVALETGALSLWMIASKRTEVRECVFAVLFCMGTLFAVAWSCLALEAMSGDSENSPGWVLLLLTPVPCVWIYGRNAWLALRNAAQLADLTDGRAR